MHSSPSDDRPVAIVDRADSPRGFLNTAWPLIALALLLLVLVRACVPAAPSMTPPPASDAGAAAPHSALAAWRLGDGPRGRPHAQPAHRLRHGALST